MARKREEGVFYHPETGEVLNGLRQSLLSLDGRFEYPDPVPMEVPTNLSAPSGMRQLVHQLIRQELSEFAASQEMETFEEADDFEIEDDPLDPLTEYEKVFDTPASLVQKTGGGGNGGGGVPSAPPPSANPEGSVSQETVSNVKRSEGNDPRTGSSVGSVDSGNSEGADKLRP